MGDMYIAVDIGASSGRCMVGRCENGVLDLKEAHRFKNGMEMKNGHLCWDTESLYEEIITGMRKCADGSGNIRSIGIDTWGVDFVLLDDRDRMITDAVGYRDRRTEGIDKEVYKIISEADLYARTGIQKEIFNTIYQLMALKLQDPGCLCRAQTMLMMPDYFHFLLSGEKVQEYSEATTSQLLDPFRRDWDRELIEMLGFPQRIFHNIVMPGTNIGHLRGEVCDRVGFCCDVVIPPAHDTASAILSLPTDSEGACYISSGTWSLMGVEMKEPYISPKGQAANFTNEGGYNGAITYLTNIMGLWMIQSVRRELASDISYSKLCDEASRETISSCVDCGSSAYLAPVSMAEEVRKECMKSGQEVPETLPQLACVIYNSLAECYRQTMERIEDITGSKYQTINIIGGGSNADYLNELTARRTRKRVICGPGEATAIGNVLSQMISAGEIKDVASARRIVADSFPLKIYG